MSKSPRSSAELLEQLATHHGFACRIMVDLMQAIDREKREEEREKAHPFYEVASFDLSELSSVFGSTIENLAASDATTPGFDHAGRVMQSFFEALASKGYELESRPLTEQEHTELLSKLVEPGVEVELKDPTSKSAYGHAFVGSVVAVNDDLVCVEDMESNCFDVELSEIERVVS